MSNKPKLIKAFSILEMTVTLGITAVIMMMLSNVLVNSIGISQKALARSFIREEVAQISDAIFSDINAANEIENCIGTIENMNCQILIDQKYTWKVCPGATREQRRICKTNADGEIIYVSAQALDIKIFTIEPGFEEGGSISRRNLLITISGDHVAEGLDIKNVIKQTAVSTRNYIL